MTFPTARGQAMTAAGVREFEIRGARLCALTTENARAKTKIVQSKNQKEI